MYTICSTYWLFQDIKDIKSMTPAAKCTEFSKHDCPGLSGTTFSIISTSELIKSIAYSDLEIF